MPHFVISEHCVLLTLIGQNIDSDIYLKAAMCLLNIFLTSILVDPTQLENMDSLINISNKPVHCEM